ncbi:MAG: SPOR domain-containing protein [bacterium]
MPKPKTPFELFWEALGKFVLKASLIIAIVLLVLFGFLLGASQGNLSDIFNNLPFLPSPSAPGANTPVASIPGEKLYAVVVASAPTELQARTIINQLRASNIVASSFFANGSYVVYIGDLRTIAQAENALSKVRGKGFPGARIVP